MNDWGGISDDNRVMILTVFSLRRASLVVCISI